MLVEMPCFVFEFRYSGGKTPLIIVSDLAPSKTDFQASPHGGAEADFEALRSILNAISWNGVH
jgi:hypothetical protein